MISKRARFVMFGGVRCDVGEVGMVLVVGRLTEDCAEEGAVGESEAGGVSDLGRSQSGRGLTGSVSHLM